MSYLLHVPEVCPLCTNTILPCFSIRHRYQYPPPSSLARRSRASRAPFRRSWNPACSRSLRLACALPRTTCSTTFAPLISQLDARAPPPPLLCGPASSLAQHGCMLCAAAPLEGLAFHPVKQKALYLRSRAAPPVPRRTVRDAPRRRSAAAPPPVGSARPPCGAHPPAPPSQPDGSAAPGCDGSGRAAAA